ncbi:hypothetical protein B0H63DRAFT_510563 [Podospora didyma]|uniref:DUF8021 domain-containing protein n=1 Tax=Podospora didyma TaxID=330526 RepID=A0AAE0TZZ1_9PEZI|nr:hypothetical protein B0H63DRAFT_510563 [Podospora didyma]
MFFYSLVLVCVGLVSRGASAACSREFLQGATSAYLQAQAAGSPPKLAVLASNFSYAENDTPLDITKGVLSQPLIIDFSRSIYDTVQCATFTEITAATSPHPYVIHTRMLFNAGDGQATKIESVVTDAGDWAFNATGHLFYTRQETWDIIPEAKRDTRAVIQAAADAYLDQWGNPDHPVPLGTPCVRLEGGFYSGKNLTANTCRMGAFPQPLNVTNRRYVIDVELGAVDVFNDFPWLDQSKPGGATPSTNFIRVEGGTSSPVFSLLPSPMSLETVRQVQGKAAGDDGKGKAAGDGKEGKAKG